MNKAKTHLKSNSVAWNKLPWSKIQKAVFKLQKRIYQAEQNGDVAKVRKLQKTLIKSYYARLLAVRKVTQDNQGKKTGGVDKVKSLTPSQRFKLAESLRLTDKSQPVRRIWIPKANGEKRPLGIPTMRDRATQALALAAIDPKWEAKFEGNSFGFRPGRSAHDAIEAIFNQIRFKPKYVLDADITKCFDCINHTKLLEKVKTFPKLRKQLKSWLKAEIHEQGVGTFPSSKGTQQGGVISPLLANIALHGMENQIKPIKGASLIRYADDFVILHENLRTLKKCQTIIEEWLAQFDLELKPSKTKISHSLYEHEGNKPGFDFLGFNIRQYKIGKYQSGKDTYGNKLGFKTIIKPSSEKVKKHYDKLAEVITGHKAAPQAALISKLNPIIKGWCNYYRTVCSSEIFSKLDHLIYLRLEKWANRRHSKKNKHWVRRKYWRSLGNDNWIFGILSEQKNFRLLKHTETKIIRHTKIQNIRTPYDGDANYWASRMGKHPEMKTSIAKLLKKQGGKCNWCSLHFQPGDKLECDHITPQKAGGNNERDNLQVLHRHCHDEKTKDDLETIRKYKAEKEWQKILKQFAAADWQWVDDIPTIIGRGTHKEPVNERSAVR